MKAIIFDMDGVLIDSEMAHKESEITALAQHGFHVTEEDLMPYVGANRAAFERGLEATFNQKVDWPSVFATKDEIFYKLMQNVKPVPGVLELVDATKNKYKLGLATSSVRRFMNFIADKFNYQHRFQTMVCGEDIVNSKPHPEIFLKAAERLQVPPQQCIAIEDSINGIRSAKAAGMFVIGITTTFPRQTLQQADLVIDHFDEITPNKMIYQKRKRILSA